jgi:hypothetical protein
MNRKTKVKYLIRFFGGVRALILTELIRQYPLRCQSSQGGFFRPDHRKIQAGMKLNKPAYEAALAGLVELGLVTLGETKAPGGGQSKSGFCRIEFENIERYLRFGRLKYFLGELVRAWHRHFQR